MTWEEMKIEGDRKFARLKGMLDAARELDDKIKFERAYIEEHRSFLDYDRQFYDGKYDGFEHIKNILEDYVKERYDDFNYEIGQLSQTATEGFNEGYNIKNVKEE